MFILWRLRQQWDTVCPVILKNNIPRYLVIDFSKADNDVVAPSEDVMIISKRLIEKNRKAYEVLAK